MKKLLLAVLALTLLSTFNSQLATARAQNAVFTCQGQVLDNGAPFTGTGQFQIALLKWGVSSSDNTISLASGSEPSAVCFGGTSIWVASWYSSTVTKL